MAFEDGNGDGERGVGQCDRCEEQPGRPLMSFPRDNWDLRESGPTDATSTVLLLPGGLCTAAFYQELMAEPKVADVRLVAATLPEHGGTRAPEDLSVENYARLTGRLASEYDCDVVVGQHGRQRRARDGRGRRVLRPAGAAGAVFLAYG